MSVQALSYDGFNSIVKSRFYTTKIMLVANHGVINCKYDIVAFGHSRINDELVVAVATKKIIKMDSLVSKKYSDEFVSISFPKNEKNVLADSIIGKDIFILDNNGLLSSFIHCGTKFMCLDDGSVVEHLPEGCKVYGYFDHTPSGIKEFMVVFKRIDLLDDRFDFMDRVSNGALSKMRERCLAATSVDALLQIIMSDYVRFGCIGTPSVNFGEIRMMVIGKKWKTKSTEPGESLLNECNLNVIDRNHYFNSNETVDNKAEIRFKAWDGMSFIDAVVFAQLLSKLTGREYTENDVVGIALQTRPATCKMLTLVVSHRMFMLLVKRQKASGVYHLAGSKNLPISVLTDMNGEKMDFDYSKPVTFEVLAVSKRSGAKLSTQIINSILGCAQISGQEITSTLQALLKNQIEGLFERFEDPEHKQPRIVSPKELDTAIRTGFIDSIIDSRCPKAIFNFKALYNSFLKQATNAAVKLANKLSVRIKGCNVRIIADPTGLVSEGQSILKYGEFFINKKVYGGATFKHPLGDIQEFYTGKNVPLKVIEKRINALPISKEEKITLFDTFASLDASVLVLPISVIAPLKSSGYDFDWDGMVLIIYTVVKKRELTLEEELTNRIIDVLVAAGERANVIERKETL